MIKCNISPRPGVRFAGTGMAIPQRVLTNDDLSRIVDTSDEWITQRTGIKQRHIADDDVGICELALDATTMALQNAGMQASELDMLLLATLTPEMSCPSSAARLVDKIGAKPAAAMDISAACCGFVNGINMAAAMIEAGYCKTVAVVGAETLSKITNYDDRRTCILFGDGAGTAILTACDDTNTGCLYQTMGSDGSLWTELYLPRCDKHLPEKCDSFTGKFNTLQMNGREVYKFAVNTTLKMIDQTLATTGVKPDQLSMVIPHQSNLRILESTREKLGLPHEKIYINIDRYGNTSAASVPICLHELFQNGRIHYGELVLFVAIGGGMTFSSSLWRL